MEKLGGLPMMSPVASVSKKSSGYSAQKSANCWSVIGGGVSVAGIVDRERHIRILSQMQRA
jgi:hypothetical protein